LTKPLVVLSGIFKNEAAGILATLEPLAPLIDVVAVLDTGSTDGTPELIEQWSKDNNKPCIVVRGSWPGRFDVARNQAMQIAQSVGAEWILEIDSDWILTGDILGLRKALEQGSPAHALQFNVLTPASEILAARLRRSDAPFTWRGGVHEEITWMGGGQPVIGHLDGVKFLYKNTTTEEQRQARYKRDIEILSQDAETNSRSAFYKAQTLANLGRIEEAVPWYVKAGENTTASAGMRAVAFFRAAVFTDNLEFFKQSYVIDPSRAEPLWEMAFRGVKGAAQLAYETPRPKNAQFVYNEYYTLKDGGPTNNPRVLQMREKQLEALFDFKAVT
jgi:hypothetical protein